MIAAKEPLTLTALKRIPLIPPPNAGENWSGIKHSDLVKEIIATSEAQDLHVDNIDLTTDNDGRALAASFQLQSHANQILDYYLGITTSNGGYAYREIERWYFGVSRPDHPAIILHSWEGSKHIPSRDVVRDVQEAIAVFTMRTTFAPHQLTELKNIVYKDREYYYLALHKAGQQGIMPWSRIGQIDHLLAVHEKTNALEVLEAFAYVARMNPPLKQMRQIDLFRQILTKESVK